jgi:hypothetical protein
MFIPANLKPFLSGDIWVAQPVQQYPFRAQNSRRFCRLAAHE